LFAVLIFDRIEPIGNLSRNVLLRDYRLVTDEIFSLVSVVIGPLLGDAEPL
jgi:hypothetical protein